jgi:hypothetical protein
MLEVIKEIPGHGLGFLSLQVIQHGKITDEATGTTVSTAGGYQIRLSDEVVVIVLPDKIYITKETP